MLTVVEVVVVVVVVVVRAYIVCNTERLAYASRLKLKLMRASSSPIPAAFLLLASATHKFNDFGVQFHKLLHQLSSVGKRIQFLVHAQASSRYPRGRCMDAVVQL